MDPASDNSVVDVRQLTIEEKEYASAYLNETDENRANAIAEIRQWILDNKDLCARTDDFFILRFLRVCKFNIEKTKMRVRNYHQQRSDLPEWFANKDPFLPEMQAILDLGVLLPLPKLDNHGRMVIFVRPFLHDPYKQKLSDVIKACLMITDMTLRNHVPGSLHGIVVFIDTENASFGHVLQINPNVIRHTVHSWQGCYPVRFQSLNFINVPIYIDAVVKILKQFMTKKMKQRLNVYKRDTENNFCNEFPADILPIEYGGTDYTIQVLKEQIKKKVQENQKWFINEEKYKVVPCVK